MSVDHFDDEVVESYTQGDILKVAYTIPPRHRQKGIQI